MTTVSSLAEVVIETETKTKKGRAFAATHVAHVTANALWEKGAGGSRGIVRPVYAVFLGSEASLRPFVANLSLGRPALVNNTYRDKAGLEFLRSAGYKAIWQRESIPAPGSTQVDALAIVTIYQPEHFVRDPGMIDPERARFVLLPSEQWCTSQVGIPINDLVQHARRLPVVLRANTPPRDAYAASQFEPPLLDDALAALAPTAYLFAAFLNHRTRAPFPADGRFYLQLLLACLGHGLASLSTTDESDGSYGRPRPFGVHPRGFREVGTAAAGLRPGVLLSATHTQLEALFAHEVTTYFAAINPDPMALLQLENARLRAENEALAAERRATFVDEAAAS